MADEQGGAKAPGLAERFGAVLGKALTEAVDDVLTFTRSLRAAPIGSVEDAARAAIVAVYHTPQLHEPLRTAMRRLHEALDTAARSSCTPTPPIPKTVLKRSKLRVAIVDDGGMLLSGFFRSECHVHESRCATKRFHIARRSLLVWQDQNEGWRHVDDGEYWLADEIAAGHEIMPDYEPSGTSSRLGDVT